MDVILVAYCHVKNQLIHIYSYTYSKYQLRTSVIQAQFNLKLEV